MHNRAVKMLELLLKTREWLEYLRDQEPLVFDMVIEDVDVMRLQDRVENNLIN